MNRSAELYLASKGERSVVAMPQARARAVLYAPAPDRAAFVPAPQVTTISRQNRARAVSLKLDSRNSRDSGFIQGGTLDDAYSVVADAGSIVDPVEIFDDLGTLRVKDVPDKQDHGLVSTTAQRVIDRGLIINDFSHVHDGGSIV